MIREWIETWKEIEFKSLAKPNNLPSSSAFTNFLPV